MRCHRLFVIISLLVGTSFCDAPAAKTNSLGMAFVPIEGPKVLICVWETRVQDFRAFVEDKKNNAVYEYRKGQAPFIVMADGWKQRGWTYGWNNPGFPQTDQHPVVCISREDAQAFCRWLTKVERAQGLIGAQQTYRLPKDWEWSEAASIGWKESWHEKREGTPRMKAKGQGLRPWGGAITPQGSFANWGGREVMDMPHITMLKNVQAKTPTKMNVMAWHEDPYTRTAPVGSFSASLGGLFDMAGNVWEWVDDNYDSDMPLGVLRGGCWLSADYNGLLLCRRLPIPSSFRTNAYGFRVALELEP